MTFPTQHVPQHVAAFDLSAEEADDYAIARVRDAAFDAVLTLWRKRQAAGMTQTDLAQAIGRDKGWVSKALRGPGNWEFKTFARLVRGLQGEADVSVYGLDDLPKQSTNYHAYKDYGSENGSIALAAAPQPSPGSLTVSIAQSVVSVS